MSKSVLAAVAVVTLLAGCVSVTGPTASPRVTAAPSRAPTAAPTVPPTATVAPTASPSPSPSPEPTATAAPTDQPTEQPSAYDDRDELFNDDLTDPTGQCTSPTGSTVPDGCFGVGDVTSGSEHIGNVSYANGTLHFAVDHDNGFIWSRRQVANAHSSMRIAAEFIPNSAGRFGLFCDSNDNELWGAVVGTDGSWALGDIGDTGLNRLVEDQNAGLDVPIGVSVPLAVECAGLVTGGLRLTLWLDETGPVAIYETDHGPDNFDRAAAYAESTSAATSIDVENIIGFGSGFADNQVTDAASELMTHIPTDWLESCYQSLRPPLFAGTAEAVVTCFIREPGDAGAEIAEYASYLTPELMNAAYQRRITVFGTGDQGDSCETGSGEHNYNIGGDPAGRLLCVEQFRGIRYDWTDDRLNILSTLVDFDGKYGKVWDDWQAGGPNL